jgi:hypothetical protein
MKLLTRDQFREGVFERDGHKCVICKAPAVDAHHIMERRLWPDGGYYLDNGASVCAECHIECEGTFISVEEVREAAGVKTIVPPHLYPDQAYDKWGNPIVGGNTGSTRFPNDEYPYRLKGELFFDPSVQKVLEHMIHVEEVFIDYVKYPRTHHLPWSGNIHDDDRVIQSLKAFEGQRVIATIKMDGENTTMYTDYIHARSIYSGGHDSRNWVKSFWGKICGDIPKGWRVCGENLYAKHSIHYKNLPSYFLGFSIWDDRNVCLSWSETLEWFTLLGITPVPVIYDDIYDEKKIKELWNKKDWESSEGYVLRVEDEFTYGNFRTHVAKFVRRDHIQTVKHWMHGQALERNELV